MTISIKQKNIAISSYNKLSAFDFSNVDRKFKEKYKSKASPRIVRKECLRFLALTKVIPKCAPPFILDNYWHEYILHTEKYSKECKIVFNRYIHHRPNDGTKKQRKADESIFWDTLQAYHKIFGEPNLYVWGIKKRS